MNKEFETLTNSQRRWVDKIISQFRFPISCTRNEMSDVMTEGAVEHMGNAMSVFHAISRRPFTVNNFQTAFSEALSFGGVGNGLYEHYALPGEDMEIEGVRVALKTESTATISKEFINISKLMKFDKGKHELVQLRDLYLNHAENYERVFVLRCMLRHTSRFPTNFEYELVEIPKALLMECADAEFNVMTDHNQNPKPEIANVYDEKGERKFSLYIGGGSERNLQIRRLRKDLCVVHATWEIQVKPILDTPPFPTWE